MGNAVKGDAELAAGGQPITLVLPGGKVVTTSGATDGPFVEAKEIVGGYMLVSAESFDRALEVARESPALMMPGSSVEIREIAGP